MHPVDEARLTLRLALSAILHSAEGWARIEMASQAGVLQRCRLVLQASGDFLVRCSSAAELDLSLELAPGDNADMLLRALEGFAGVVAALTLPGSYERGFVYIAGRGGRITSVICRPAAAPALATGRPVG